MQEPRRRNVELKARLGSFDRACRMAEQLPTTRQGMLHQVDTYFVTAQGRLKLRVINQEKAELIWYFRPNTLDPSTSHYNLVPVPEWDAMRETLAGALGVLCEVTKRRELYLWENVRIHLDQVDGLGTFLEFEAVLSEASDESGADEQLDYLRSAFEIRDSDLVAVSYSDLLLARN